MTATPCGPGRRTGSAVWLTVVFKPANVTTPCRTVLSACRGAARAGVSAGGRRCRCGCASAPPSLGRGAVRRTPLRTVPLLLVPPVARLALPAVSSGAGDPWRGEGGSAHVGSRGGAWVTVAVAIAVCLEPVADAMAVVHGVRADSVHAGSCYHRLSTRWTTSRSLRSGALRNWPHSCREAWRAVEVGDLAAYSEPA
jgi:hypothetical protein